MPVYFLQCLGCKTTKYRKMNEQFHECLGWKVKADMIWAIASNLVFLHEMFHLRTRLVVV